MSLFHLNGRSRSSKHLKSLNFVWIKLKFVHPIQALTTLDTESEHSQHHLGSMYWKCEAGYYQGTTDTSPSSLMLILNRKREITTAAHRVTIVPWTSIIIGWNQHWRKKVIPNCQSQSRRMQWSKPLRDQEEQGWMHHCHPTPAHNQPSAINYTQASIAMVERGRKKLLKFDSKRKRNWKLG